jgi:hypothetical protein
LIDVANDVFYVSKEGDKEKFLCDVCYMVPQPETIEPAPAAEGEQAGDPDTAKCSDCLNFKDPEGEAEEGVCAVHAGDPLAAYKKPEEIACDKFSAKPLTAIEDLRADVAAGEVEPGSSMSEEEVAQLQPGDVADLGELGGAPEGSPGNPADQGGKAAAPAEQVCRQCAHPRGSALVNAKGKLRTKNWKTAQKEDGSFVDICPACGAENVFPGEDEGGKAAGGEA